CYSVDNGKPIPAARTPNLDMLAQYGTAFPVAHNVSHWCLPALAGEITARYQKNFGSHAGKYEEDFVTWPTALRSLGTYHGPNDHAPGTDTYDADGINAIGGYCTFFGGKYVHEEADAKAKSKTNGRLACTTTAGAKSPKCGTRQDDP